MPDYVAGLHAVEAALHAGRVEALWLEAERRDARIMKVAEQAQERGIPMQRVSRSELEALVPGLKHQGVAARCKSRTALAEEGLEGLLSELDEAPLLLILDGVQDPHNLGACLRSADAAGAHAVIAPRDRAVGLTPVVRKVASGAAEHVPFVQVTNLARTLRWLKEHGLWLIGAAGDAEASLFETDLRGPLALVLGGEGRGLRRLTRDHCDLLARIPMRGAVESLNVSVAAGVCLFEALRQRGAAKER